MLLNDPVLKEKIAEWQEELFLITGDNNLMIVLAENHKLNLPAAELAQLIMNDVGVTAKELHSRRRERKLVLCRQLICYFLRSRSKLTLSEILRFTGMTNHTSVIHSMQKVQGFIDIGDDLICTSIARINQKIKDTMTEPKP